MVGLVVGRCVIARGAGAGLQLQAVFQIEIALVVSANGRSESCRGWCRWVGG